MGHHQTKQHYTFNPYEIAFCGYSNSGKTRLVCDLLKSLSKEYTVGYVKRDVHGIRFDAKGSDTFLAKESGANQVFIRNDQECFSVWDDQAGKKYTETSFLKNDFVFVEGYKHSDTPKIVLLDEKGDILNEVLKGNISNVLFFSGSRERSKDLPKNSTYYDRNDLKSIQSFILSYFQKKAEAVPLYGLVLTGGYSTRMKRDKFLLNYRGKSQLEYCHELLSQFCSKTFISSRQEQQNVPVSENFNYL